MAAKKDVVAEAKPTLLAIAEDQVRPLNGSFVAVLMDARRLDKLAKKHAARLKAVQTDAEMLKSYPHRIEVLVATQDALESKTLPSRSKQEKALTVQAEALRHSMLQELEFAFRDGSLAAEISAIRDGNGLADLIDDLHAVSRLYARKVKALSFIKGAAQRADLAETLGTRLADLVAERGATVNDTRPRQLRDRAFTWLDDASRELRAAGRFAFRDEPEVSVLFSTPARRGPRTRSPAP